MRHKIRIWIHFEFVLFCIGIDFREYPIDAGSIVNKHTQIRMWQNLKVNFKAEINKTYIAAFGTERERMDRRRSAVVVVGWMNRPPPPQTKLYNFNVLEWIDVFLCFDVGRWGYSNGGGGLGCPICCCQLFNVIIV